MIKAKLIDALGRLMFLAVALAALWFWGNYQLSKRVKAECELKASQCKIEVMEQKQAEVKNVEVKKSVIYSKPNAGRNSLLNKMRAGQL